MRFTLRTLKFLRSGPSESQVLRLGSHHAPRRGPAIPPSRAVGHRLAAALYKDAEPGMDVCQPGSHQGAVPVVQLAASVRGGGALGPAFRQCAFRIAPADEFLE